MMFSGERRLQKFFKNTLPKREKKRRDTRGEILKTAESEWYIAIHFTIVSAVAYDSDFSLKKKTYSPHCKIILPKKEGKKTPQSMKLHKIELTSTQEEKHFKKLMNHGMAHSV